MVSRSKSRFLQQQMLWSRREFYHGTAQTKVSLGRQKTIPKPPGKWGEMPTDSQSATTPPIPTALSFTSNFPVPAPMKVSGDWINNWEFFRQQWEDYELATGLDKQPEAIRLATLRSVMGKDCLQIFLNLKLTEEESTSVNASLAALEAYFKPKTSVVYERYLFNSSTLQLIGPDEGIE